MSVLTYYVCPHRVCLFPPNMSVPTYYYLSPPIMPVPIYNVCPHLLCMSPPIILPNSAPSWILSQAENPASSSLQDGATKWYYFLSKPAGRPAGWPPDHLNVLSEVKAQTWPHQVPTCKMEPRSGSIFCLNRPADRPATRPPQYFIRRKSPNMTHLSCLSPPIMSVPTYYVCPHLFCLSPPIVSVPTYYVCPHLSCLSPPIMSVPTYHVCPHLQGVRRVSDKFFLTR